MEQLELYPGTRWGIGENNFGNSVSDTRALRDENGRRTTVGIGYGRPID
jgi:hypothetical protein